VSDAQRIAARELRELQESDPRNKRNKRKHGGNTGDDDDDEGGGPDLAVDGAGPQKQKKFKNKRR